MSRLPLFIIKTAGTKSWFVPHALNFLGAPPWPKTIVEPFAGSAIVGLSLLNHGCAERLVLAEKDKDYLAFWHTALGDSKFSYRVSKWTEQVLGLPFQEQKPFVEASLDRMKEEDPGFWILLRSRIGFNGKKVGGFMTEKSRGGILCRWPRTLDASLDLLYSLRDQITVMEDGFEALATFDSEDSYTFVDPPYTVTEECPGHDLYDEAVMDHQRLYRMLAAWKGRWQLTYNASAATMKPLVATTIELRERWIEVTDDGAETVTDEKMEIVRRTEGEFFSIPGLDDNLVEMTSGRGSGGSKKKFEMVVCTT